ncbi:MAG: FAD-binding oxidoreductase, partial [Gammaproteobacteria bacterium]
MLATAAVDTPHFIAALRRVLPAEAVIVEVEALRVYECDALSAYRELPMAVVVPERVEEVQAVLRLCRAHEVPVVA